MKRAVFPGTFDPFTIGHYSVVRRGLNLFDEIIIAIGLNSTKKTLFPLEKRVEIIEQTYANEEKIKVVTYDSLTVDFAISMEADYILRGLRTVGDFEYEHSIAATNKKIANIETVLLFTEYEYSYVSSSVVRDLIRYNKDISPFLPPNIVL